VRGRRRKEEEGRGVKKKDRQRGVREKGWKRGSGESVGEGGNGEGTVRSRMDRGRGVGGGKKRRNKRG